LWDAFIGEEMSVQQVLTSYKDEVDVLDLALIREVRRVGRKRGLGRDQKHKEEELDSSC
jgi:hypothetical protein